MKYLIIDLNFLVENPQAPLENITPPLVAQPPPPLPPPPRKIKFQTTLFKNASKFLGSPCRKGEEDTVNRHHCIRLGP